MAEQRVQRRLAAILAADVVGFSRLMEQDETGTLSALKARRRDVISPLIGKHQGRLVKVMGDGVLVEFASAASAVQCAIELQRDTAAANDKLPEDKRIVMRVGINLGDVIVEGSDLYGDGVNIAARLEALAQPGGICISAKVHDEVRGKIDASFADCGDQQLKNMEASVRAWHWVDGAGTSAAATPPRAAASKPSIAVLPFANLSGNKEQRFFSDGVTDDIITELARLRQMHVLARNASFRYRGTDLDMVRVGRELGAQYLVEGSVQRNGTRLRLTAELIDASTGHLLWAEKFDRDQNDIFAVQDQIVRTIVTTLARRVQTAGAEIARRKAPASLAAYECVLRAEALPLYDPAAGVEARQLYEKAIEIDPGYARAYARLAVNFDVEWECNLDAPDSLLDRALDVALRAVALDDNDSACHSALGLVYLNRRAHELAEHHYLKALALNPSRPNLLTSIGFLYACLGRPEDAMDYLRQARAADPFFEPSWYWATLGTAHFVGRQYDEAITAIRRASEASPWSQALVAAAHAHRGEDAEARRHAAEVLRLAPNFSIRQSMAREPLKREADRTHLVGGLRRAGLPE